MQTLDYLKTMCHYNQWMNEKLYAVCETIPDEVRKKDLGAFFRSMHGTLNHLLLADRVWLGRFKNVPFSVQSLDQELYADFATLRRERAKTDAAIHAYIDSLTPEQINGDLHYISLLNPEPRVLPLALALLHFFNHQTHHRGQLTTLMNQTGYDSGVTDLLVMPQA